MESNILNKLNDLYTAIDINLKIDNNSIIVGENQDECNLIGTEDSYLTLIKYLAKFLLVKNKILIDEKGDYEFEDENSFSSSEIKNAIDELSDSWIVGLILQETKEFEKTVLELRKKKLHL
jgi:hypothetical protein